MAFVLNPGLLGVLDKIEKANVLSESEMADLRVLVRDCHVLDSLYGVDVHQLAEEKRKATKAKLSEAIEDSLHLFSERSISNHLNGAPKLVDKRKKARATGEYLVYYSIAYMVSVTGCSIYKAQQKYAEQNGRTLTSVKRQYLTQKKKLGIK